MPHCPNCGKRVQAEHHYCGRCGYPLANQKEDEVDIPPTGTAIAERGFLSGRSVDYLHDVVVQGEELNSESVGYANLSRDVVAGLADFAIVSFASEVSLLRILAEGTEPNHLNRDLDQLNKWRRIERLAWIGLIQLPALYYQIFGSGWRRQLSKRLNEIAE